MPPGTRPHAHVPQHPAPHACARTPRSAKPSPPCPPCRLLTQRTSAAPCQAQHIPARASDSGQARVPDRATASPLAPSSTSPCCLAARAATPPTRKATQARHRLAPARRPPSAVPVPLVLLHVLRDLTTHLCRPPRRRAGAPPLCHPCRPPTSSPAPIKGDRRPSLRHHDTQLAISPSLTFHRRRRDRLCLSRRRPPPATAEPPPQAAIVQGEVRNQTLRCFLPSPFTPGRRRAPTRRRALPPPVGPSSSALNRGGARGERKGVLPITP